MDRGADRRGLATLMAAAKKAPGRRRSMSYAENLDRIFLDELGDIKTHSELTRLLSGASDSKRHPGLKRKATPREALIIRLLYAFFTSNDSLEKLNPVVREKLKTKSAMWDLIAKESGLGISVGTVRDVIERRKTYSKKG